MTFCNIFNPLHLIDDKCNKSHSLLFSCAQTKEYKRNFININYVTKRDNFFCISIIVLKCIFLTKEKNKKKNSKIIQNSKKIGMKSQIYAVGVRVECERGEKEVI